MKIDINLIPYIKDHIPLEINHPNVTLRDEKTDRLIVHKNRLIKAN